MIETLYVILIAFGSSVATGFGQWFFFRRKNKADAEVTEAAAIKEEIANYKQIIDDWKKNAEEWQKHAEEYRCMAFQQRKEIDEMYLKVQELESNLKRANKKILELEKNQKQQTDEV